MIGAGPALRAVASGMEEENIYGELSEYLKHSPGRGRVLICRGDEERELLSGWIHPDSEIAGEIARIEDIRELIETCDSCGDVDERKFGIGTGKNQVMIILNAPPLVNAVEKKMLKKDSVELLKKIIQAAGLAFNECYITNLVKCDIRNPLMKPSQAIQNCGRIIDLEIGLMKPRVAVVFGDLLPLQKIIKESREIIWFNIDHPIMIIKNPDLKRPAWNTLKIIMAKLKELNLL